MLSARAATADEQCRHHKGHIIAETGKNITKTSENGTEPKHGRRTESFCQKARRNLEACQRAGKDRLHQSERGKPQTKFALPDGKHHIDQIGVTVVQSVRATGDAKRAPLGTLCRVQFWHCRVVASRAKAPTPNRKNDARVETLKCIRSPWEKMYFFLFGRFFRAAAAPASPP